MLWGNRPQVLWTAAALWLSCVIYLAPLHHRPHVRVRTAVYLALGLLGGAALSAVQPWNSWLTLALQYVFTLVFFFRCGELSPAATLYCGVWAQITQQLAQEACLMLYCYAKFMPDWGAAGWLALAAGIYAAGYSAVGLTVARWMPVDRRYHIGPRQLSLALLMQLIFQILFHLITQGAQFPHPLYPATIFMAQVYCATMLYLQNALFVKSAMRQELAILNHLWYEQKEQYQLAKETIAIINRKCHDLKHQIAAMRTVLNKENQEKYLLEIEGSVRIYDAIFKTGNEVLDTVLTEKSLNCEANDIQVTCVADGRRLAFMDPVDLYSILGNALDNAIESVQQLSGPDKRMIDVLICARRRFLVLRVSNPLEEELTFENGLPVSTKPYDGCHGFGLKSIRYTAEKYGGFATVSTENGQFQLKILIPLTEE